MKNLMVAQSGGPTAAINSTLCGILKMSKTKNIKTVFGAKFGVKGLLKKDILNLTEKLTGKEELLKWTPASILGSCRFKLKDFNESEEEYEKILDVFKEYNIGYFIYIGGNDSMDTVLKISEYLKSKNIKDIFIVGAPKTIDNDLLKTDHCPGFGSAAKYIATTFSEIEKDTEVYNIKAITLVETMGRDTGWLTAASCLPRINGQNGPCLTYCCEKEFSIEEFLKDIEEKFKEKPNLLVALSEGLKIKEKELFLEKEKNEKQDMFGHSQNAGVAKILEKVVRKNFDVKVRSIELNLPQRAAAHIASKTDIQESFEVGKKAVELATKNETAIMVTILRKDGEKYEVEFSKTAVENVANKIRKMPQIFLSQNTKDISQKAIEYLKPLIIGQPDLSFKNGLPIYLKL